MKPIFQHPIPIKKGDSRVLLNGEPPLTDCRVVSEEYFRRMISSIKTAGYTIAILILVIILQFLFSSPVFGQKENRTKFYNDRVDPNRQRIVQDTTPFTFIAASTHTFVGYYSNNTIKSLGSVKPENCYRIKFMEGDSLLGYVRCDGKILIRDTTTLIKHLKHSAFCNSFMYEFGLLDFFHSAFSNKDYMIGPAGILIEVIKPIKYE